MRSAILIALSVLLAACGRPTGDFGRAGPSVLHDQLLPELGRRIAEDRRHEPVSRFPLTDDERALRDRAWTFVRPPHAGDWWLETLVEGQRTRVLPMQDPSFDPGRYHAFLITAAYTSSEGRWAKVIEDIQADAMLVPPFCAMAARVRRADAERLAALARKSAPDGLLVEDAFDRVDENNAVMAWVWRALAWRLSAYRIALDRLEVETPSAQLWDANRAFSALAAALCTDAPRFAALTAPARPAAARPFRGPDPFDAPVLQK